MEPQILLYIGGVADGERKLTKHHKTMVSKFTGAPRLINGMFDDLAAIHSDITQDLYRRERLCGAKRTACVMVLDSMTTDDMIEALISKYPAPKNDD